MANPVRDQAKPSGSSEQARRPYLSDSSQVPISRSISGTPRKLTGSSHVRMSRFISGTPCKLTGSSHGPGSSHTEMSVGLTLVTTSAPQSSRE